MWPNLQFSLDLVTFTEEILNEELHFFLQWREKLFDIPVTNVANNLKKKSLISNSSETVLLIGIFTWHNYWTKCTLHIFLTFATVLFLYPLKASENQRFSDISRLYREGPVTENGLIEYTWICWTNASLWIGLFFPFKCIFFQPTFNSALESIQFSWWKHVFLSLPNIY